MTTFLTAVYLIAFQACAIPAVLKLRRLRASDQLSIWREVFLLIGVTAQFLVMVRTGASLEVLVSPILSGVNVLILAGHIVWYRRSGG